MRVHKWSPDPDLYIHLCKTKPHRDYGIIKDDLFCCEVKWRNVTCKKCLKKKKANRLAGEVK